MSPNDGVQRKTRPTLADVAKLAGVSPATASKALSGRQNVKASTKTVVLAAADQLGFRPNRQAQLLASGRSRSVGLVTHDLEGRFSIPIMMGAEEALGSGRMSVLLSDARRDSVREQQHIETLLSDQVDGLIVVGAAPDPRPSLGVLPVPVVYAYGPSTDPNDISVVVDNVESGRMIVRHLLACGRSQIAVVAGDITHIAATDRAKGAIEVLNEAGLTPLGGDAFYGAWNEIWGRGATRAILNRFPHVDGIVCLSDELARGVLDVLHDRDVAVPSDVSVVSNDNYRILVEGARPPLTSVDMCLEDVGRKAAELLLDAIRGKHRPGMHYVRTRLVVRDSTL